MTTPHRSMRISDQDWEAISRRAERARETRTEYVIRRALEPRRDELVIRIAIHALDAYELALAAVPGRVARRLRSSLKTQREELELLAVGSL